MSSAIKGVQKSYSKERIDGAEYCVEVGFGAVTGVFTGGVGAAGEVVAANVAKEGVKQVAIRVGSGVVAGVTTKAISEVKDCSTNQKEWSDFGKTLNKDGECSTIGTVASWATSGLTGGLGSRITQL